MSWSAFTFLFALFITFKIVVNGSFKSNVLYTTISVLYNIPVIILGNSSSSGIFVFDIALIIFSIKAFIMYRVSFNHIIRLRSNRIFLALLVYILFRTVFVLLEDYGYYNKFILYGFYRWFSFGIFVFLVSVHSWKYSEVLWVVKRFYLAFLIFLVLGVIHRLEFIDLSGYEAMGMDEDFFINEEYSDFFLRTLLGNVSASVGFIASLGILLSLLFLKLNIQVRLAISGLVLSTFVLLGSWSRSDVIALALTLFVALLFFGRKLIGINAMRFSFSVFTIALLAFGVLAYQDRLDLITENRTFQRFFQTEYTNQLSGKSEGTLAFRVFEQGKALKHLMTNPQILVFGFGPNGYRMFMVNGVSNMGYGHNIYLHTISELGVLGALIILTWLRSVFRTISIKVRGTTSFPNVFGIFVLLLLFHRLIAGYAVDSIFAVDNTLPMTILFLFFILIIARIQNPNHENHLGY